MLVPLFCAVGIFAVVVVGVIEAVVGWVEVVAGVVVGVDVGGKLVVINSKRWTTMSNSTVRVPTWLLAVQVYSPSSAGVTDLMMRTLPLKGEVLPIGDFQMYEGVGFPAAEQFSCRGFPSVMMIESRSFDSFS